VYPGNCVAKSPAVIALSPIFPTIFPEAKSPPVPGADKYPDKPESPSEIGLIPYFSAPS